MKQLLMVLWAFVGVGSNNKAECMGFVATGNSNCAICSNYSFVGGGVFNVACGGSIMGGESNISVSGGIGGGFGNVICAGGANAFIGAGQGNQVYAGTSSTIGAGCQNNIGNALLRGADYSFIGSGFANCIDGAGPMPNSTFWDAIGGGQSNKICTDACNSGIFGGNGNTVAANSSFIGGGNGNFIDGNVLAGTPYGVIGGGQQNKICLGANHSSIFGGFVNTVAGHCSSILGGANNNDGGLNNVFIAGSGITAVNANSLHINALWAGSIPGPYGSPPVLPAGTVWYGPAGIVGACALYIN